MCVYLGGGGGEGEEVWVKLQLNLKPNNGLKYKTNYMVISNDWATDLRISSIRSIDQDNYPSQYDIPITYESLPPCQ